jgi:hypothetical protein
MRPLVSLILKRLRNRGIHVTVLVLAQARRHHSFILLPLLQLLSQTLSSRLPTGLLSSFQTLKLICSSQMAVTTLYGRDRPIVHVISDYRSKLLFSFTSRRPKSKRLSTLLNVRFGTLNTTVRLLRRANQGSMRSSILLRKHSLRSGYFPLLLTVTWRTIRSHTSFHSSTRRSRLFVQL